MLLEFLWIATYLIIVAAQPSPTRGVIFRRMPTHVLHLFFSFYLLPLDLATLVTQFFRWATSTNSSSEVLIKSILFRRATKSGRYFSLSTLYCPGLSLPKLTCVRLPFSRPATGTIEASMLGRSKEIDGGFLLSRGWWRTPGNSDRRLGLIARIN